MENTQFFYDFNKICYMCFRKYASNELKYEVPNVGICCKSYCAECNFMSTMSNIKPFVCVLHEKSGEKFS